MRHSTFSLHAVNKVMSNFYFTDTSESQLKEKEREFYIWAEQDSMDTWFSVEVKTNSKKFLLYIHHGLKEPWQLSTDLLIDLHKNMSKGQDCKVLSCCSYYCTTPGIPWLYKNNKQVVYCKLFKGWLRISKKPH